MRYLGRRTRFAPRTSRASFSLAVGGLNRGPVESRNSPGTKGGLGETISPVGEYEFGASLYEAPRAPTDCTLLGG